jgi:hypothetical protein
MSLGGKPSPAARVARPESKAKCARPVFIKTMDRLKSFENLDCRLLVWYEPAANLDSFT